ncbi:hypothetical protein Poly30_01890 [Planctomycetes bacterium Poly30]|uniref:DUF2911 domain-containing protein n=1 Tax=Saltatorellus ferox TaxID=2528018 RepID=A0A518EKS7_9BACT|nr:hypothetical protein Poly30_01890 [Planctomycetes bacterium Poly30]
MRLSLLSLTFASLAATVLAPAALAQLGGPPKSPHATVTQQIGLGEVVLDYSRPSVRGREIFGGLEPWGAVWRAGANASSKITLDQDATFGGESVEAGTYAIYVIPMENADWTFILSNQTDLWGADGYDPAEDAVRLSIKPTKLAATHETLTIDFQGFHANGAELFIAWADMHLSVPVMVDTDTKMMQRIDEKVRNATGDVSARTYFDAAMYMIDKKEGLEEASSWMDKANEMQPGTFWMMYQQADLALTMGNTDKAKRVGMAALEAAKAAKATEGGDFGYTERLEAFLAKLK